MKAYFRSGGIGSSILNLSKH